MRRLRQILLLCCLIGAGFWLWTVFFPNPERVIHKRLETIATLASFSPGEGNIARVANVEKLGAMFADDAEVFLNEMGGESFHFTDRAEVTQAAIAARSAGGGLHVKLDDIKIDLSPDKDSAIVHVTAHARVDGQADAIFAQFQITFKKIKRDWLITRVETVRTLK